MNLQAIETILQAEPETAAPLFRELIRGAVITAMAEAVEHEVRALCGPAYDPLNGGDFFRGGSAPSSVHLHGVKTEFKRPRVRERLDEGGSREVSLRVLNAAKDNREWEDLVIRGVLCGVSTRDQQALHPEQLDGKSHAAISRMWIKRAAELVGEINESDLSDFELLTLMMDGTVLAEGLHAIIALGVDPSGRKRVLGFAVGASENREVCTDLVNSLVERGLKPCRRRPLAVIDGSKVLRQAILAVWSKAVIQRCLVHKERNLYGYLPRKHHPKLKAFFKKLRNSQGKEPSVEIVADLEAWIGSINAIRPRPLSLLCPGPVPHLKMKRDTIQTSPEGVSCHMSRCPANSLYIKESKKQETAVVPERDSLVARTDRTCRTWGRIKATKRQNHHQSKS